MDAKDVFSTKQKDRLLKKMVDESRKTGDTTENRTILYRYSTDDEIEIAILEILEAEGFVVYKSRHSGKCHYSITKLALGFVKNGGYKKLNTINFYKKVNNVAWASVTHIATLIAGFIAGLMADFIFDLF